MTLGFAEDDDLGKLNPFLLQRNKVICISLSWFLETMLDKHVSKTYFYILLIHVSFQKHIYRIYIYVFNLNLWGWWDCCKQPVFLKSFWNSFKWIALMNVNIKQCMQHILYFSVDSSQGSSSEFDFFQCSSLSAIVLILFFLCSVCTLFTRIEPLFFITHIPQAFVHSYKASHFNSSYKSIYFCLISGDRVLVCCPVTSIVFILLFIFVFIFLV